MGIHFTLYNIKIKISQNISKNFQKKVVRPRLDGFFTLTDKLLIHI
jgi:hypothetical protein